MLAGDQAVVDRGWSAVGWAGRVVVERLLLLDGHGVQSRAKATWLLCVGGGRVVGKKGKWKKGQVKKRMGDPWRGVEAFHRVGCAR